MQTTLTFFVNGQKVVDEHPDPEWTLGRYLRNRLLLTGTKISCDEGECGLCTVMVSKYDCNQKKVKHCAVRSCLTSIASVHGCAVTTVEGVGNINKGLHPVQERLAKRHGAQCGFCTPGFVMAMYTLLRNNAKPTKCEIEMAIEGNLCRCTGYRPILEAFYSFADNACPCGFQGACCKASEAPGSVQPKELILSNWNHLRLYDASQDPIFPPELIKMAHETLHFKGNRITWFSPANLNALMETVRANSGAKIIAAGAITSLLERTSSTYHKTLISVCSVEELRSISVNENELIIGSGLSIAEFEHGLKEFKKSHASGVVDLFLGMFHHVGSDQLRNCVSWVGNLASGWHLSDLSLCFMVAASRAHIQSASGAKRCQVIDNEFFVGKCKTAIQPDEVITGVSLQIGKPGSKYYHLKQGHRPGHDNAIVNAAVRFFVDEKSMIIEECCFAFGGIAYKPHMVILKDKLDLKNNKATVFETVMKFVEKDVEHARDKTMDKAEYRLTLALSFVFKFLKCLDQSLSQQAPCASTKHEHVEATQIVPEVLSGQPTADPVGRPLTHNSIDKLTTGQATFLDDIPSQSNECHLALVVSEKAHAQVKMVDSTEACQIPGVLGFIGVGDIPEKGTNLPGGPMMGDTYVFADGKVNCCGDPIGAIVAENALIAKRAAKLVKVVYEDLPPILTIEEGINRKATLGPSQTCSKGDTEKGLAESAQIITGEVTMNIQEHFYMEPMCCIVSPKDGNEYEIISSTQSPGWLHTEASNLLGVSANRIVVKVKRIGGGFGGKGQQAYVAAWPTIVAAHKFQRPVRFVMTREIDMETTGKRPSFLAKFKAGIQTDGKIHALQVVVYLNAGCKTEMSPFLIHACVANFDDGYHIPNMSVEGWNLRLNYPPNTAFRGAGQPEGQFLMECVMEKIARAMNVDAVELRHKHLYKTGDMILHGYPLPDCSLEKCWQECIRIAQYDKRKTDVENFNKQNLYKKRGLSMTTVKHGVGDLGSPLEQGGVLAHIYLDGTVQLNHGGVEMGQGLHAKLLQVASRVLKTPIENITTLDTTTDKVPNSMVTAGSLGTDIYAPAVKEACETLMQRLEPYIFKNPKGTFADWARAAHMDRVSLSATGYGRPVGENPDGKRHDKPRYFVYGVACIETEIDCLTGNHVVLETNLVMDIGSSINPALDIGQIEGGYTQGYGCVTMEELVHNANGQLVTNSNGTYKIPTICNVPKKFHVMILKDGVSKDNKDNIYSSKGIGEPPLALGFCAYFSILEAIKTARKDAGLNDPLNFESPATSERIRLACPKCLKI